MLGSQYRRKGVGEVGSRPLKMEVEDSNGSNRQRSGGIDKAG